MNTPTHNKKYQIINPLNNTTKNYIACVLCILVIWLAALYNLNSPPIIHSSIGYNAKSRYISALNMHHNKQWVYITSLKNCTLYYRIDLDSIMYYGCDNPLHIIKH